VLLVLAGALAGGLRHGYGQGPHWFHAIAFVLVLVLAIYVILDFELRGWTDPHQRHRSSAPGLRERHETMMRQSLLERIGQRPLPKRISCYSRHSF